MENHLNHPPDMMREQRDILPLEERASFSALRLQAHRQVMADVRQRLRERPQPTPLERRLGCFIEQLEPQVRNVIVLLQEKEKPYQTSSSGFDYPETQRQRLDIVHPFSITDEGKKSIHMLTQETGIPVQIDDETPYGTMVSFEPPEANLERITTIWNQIAEALPNCPVPQSTEWYANPLFNAVHSDAMPPELTQQQQEAVLAIRAKPELIAFFDIDRSLLSQEFLEEAHRWYSQFYPSKPILPEL